jgi:uncharacterized protein
MLVQTILWRRLDVPGHDACGLLAMDSGWRLTGTAAFGLDNRSCHLHYVVDCVLAWRTRSATVTGWIGRNAVQLAITALPDQGWSLNGTEQAAVAGCLDLDLAFTPATNLIALRRLALGVGDEADAPAAWLRFPELVLERLDQQYRRLDRYRYAYRAPGTGYAGILEVTDAGFVTRYPGLWEMETPG